MYEFKYQEVLNNLIIQVNKGGMVTTTTTVGNSTSQVALFHMPKKDLVELLTFVANLVAKGCDKDEKEN